MSNNFHRRLRRLELVQVVSENVMSQTIDRPPAETREQWIARRDAGKHWAKVADAWVLQVDPDRGWSH